MRIKDHFELRRQLDNLTYRFDRTLSDDGSYAYKRQDADLWIVREPDFGWIAVDPFTDKVAGRPWSILPVDQKDYPPEGDWVSKKGSKSYVYSLSYVDNASAT